MLDQFKLLTSPFALNGPPIQLKDRVWYIPERRTQISAEFSFQGWQHADYFGNDNPVYIEYCSGNGDWIAAKALEYPLINWVAVEKKIARVSKIWSKMKKFDLNNLIIIAGEAHVATRRYFGSDSIANVFINFPDPWPKNRHAKNRIIQLEFVNELWRILHEGKALTFVTDDPPYSDWLIEVMRVHGGFESLYPHPYYSKEEVTYGASYFDDLWRSKGRIIRHHKFRKI